MAYYIFHNETKSKVASKKLFICPEDDMEIMGYFNVIIKNNDWDKKEDVICAISVDNEPVVLVYENDTIVLCDEISHIERLNKTLDDVAYYNLEDDELISIKYEDEQGVICDCGSASEVDSEFFDNDTEIDEDGFDEECEYESEDEYKYVESEYESEDEDVEDELWLLRKKMVGLKNITKSKIESIKHGYNKLMNKLPMRLKVELAMDILKYVWKSVIRDFIDEDTFKYLRDEIFESIENRLDTLEDYMRVEYDYFKTDLLRVSCMV